MTWTAPGAERAYPDLTTGERAALDQWLDYHRATLVAKCAGLTEDQLKERSCAPSRLSLLGLLRHMTEVERWWFSTNAAGRPPESIYGEGPEDDFEHLDSTPADVVVAAYLREVEASHAAVAGLDLDHEVPSAGHHPERVRNLRWIYLHMIEEYARHNGHADLLRERVDGATGV
jgi:uncharacterized damage-inducible protein DinB